MSAFEGGAGSLGAMPFGHRWARFTALGMLAAAIALLSSRCCPTYSPGVSSQAEPPRVGS